MTGEKFYLTKKGFEKLKKECEALKEMRLAKTRGEAPKILHSEDLDPEYISFQEDLTFVETRLSELENVIKNAHIICSPQKDKRDEVNLGAIVKVQIDKEHEDEFTIVGTLEASPALGKISNASPVGKALLGHKVGDEIIISSPIRTVYRIKKIKYLES